MAKGRGGNNQTSSGRRRTPTLSQAEVVTRNLRNALRNGNIPPAIPGQR